MDSQPAQQADENGLLPCPFCGGKVEMLGDGLGGIEIYCGNGNCFLQVEYAHHASVEEAIATWNRRVPATQPQQAMPQPDSAPIVFEVGAPEHTAMARVLANTMGDLSEEVYAAGWMRDCEYEIWQELQGEKPHWFICDANDRATLKLLSGMVDGWIMWDDEIGGTRFVPMSEWLSRHDEWLQRRPTPAP